ncbi:copper resistance CopC family protein [Glaciibacter superstes]|uniref:copper resistance CopC family protein n=1 Tax=Glaciibacter superstes TaxID=501023 RepID=UPI0003B3E61B|nr:copper resistance CopC family protein [Glaciibacter superstes]
MRRITSRTPHQNLGASFGLAAFGAIVIVAALGLSAAPASAHNYVVSTSPEADSVVTVQPATFSVTTNDNLLDLDGAGSGSAIQVRGPEGAPEPLYYGDGCASVFGPTVETEAQLGEAGVYTVVWQVVSTDGHPVSDEYTFTWQPDAAQEQAEGATTPPDCGGTGQDSAGDDSAGQAGDRQAGDGQAGDQATDAAGDDASAPTGAALADVVWIGIALGAVVLAVLGTLLVVLRKRPTPPAGPPASGAPPRE